VLELLSAEQHNKVDSSATEMPKPNSLTLRNQMTTKEKKNMCISVADESTLLCIESFSVALIHRHVL
jgi:hypothetical protein